MQSSLRELVKVFDSELIPWAKNRTLRPILAHLPLRPPAGVNVVTRSAPELAKAESQSYSLNPERWPALGLHACRYPSLACVVEGEADLSIGVTRDMAAAAQVPTTANSLRIVSLSTKDMFLFPGGVPCSDSSRAHWDKVGETPADSRILWLRVLPFGAQIQMCQTVDGRHGDIPALFVKNARISPLMQVLLESAADLPRSSEIVDACLLTLLLCVGQSWSSTRTMSQTMTSAAARGEPGPGAHYTSEVDPRAAVVERACSYIQTNLMHRITLPEIARNAYVSVPQLKRLFRSELDTSVMKYVTQHRLQEVKSLLADTDIAIHEISFLCGYRHRTQFTRAFTGWAGISPQEFRRQQRSAGALRRRSTRQDSKPASTSASRKASRPLNPSLVKR